MAGIYLTRDELRTIAAARAQPTVQWWIEHLLLPECQAAIELPLERLEQPAEVGADWICPTHNAQLEVIEGDLRALRCPVDGEQFTGRRRTSARQMFDHETAANGARSLALLAAIDDGDQYATTARAILNHYSARYPRWSAVNGPTMWHTSRAMPFGLMETTWIQALTFAADLLYQCGQADRADMQRWADGLFLPCAGFLKDQISLVHNIRCWMNGAVAMIGWAFDEPELVEHANAAKWGWHHQLVSGLLEDDTWCETSPLYQFYCLQAMVIHAEAAMRQGVDLYADERVGRMCRAAMRYVLSDGRLVPLNDTPPGNRISPFLLATLARRFESVELSELGESRVATFRREVEARDLSAMKLCRHGGRLIGDVLLHEADVDVVGGRRVIQCGQAGASPHLLSLRNDEAGHAVFMEHGSKAASHMHYERLSLCIELHDRPVLIDRGAVAYHLPGYDFYRYTPAHNTLAHSGWHHLHVSPSSVLENASGRIKAEAEIHQGVMLARNVRLDGDAVHDELQISSRVKQFGGHFDLYLHPPGEPQLGGLSLQSADMQPQYFGYEAMTSPCRLAGALPSSIIYQCEGYRVIIEFESLPRDAELWFLKTPGPGHQPHIPITAMIVRHDACASLTYRLRYRITKEARDSHA